MQQFANQERKNTKATKSSLHRTKEKYIKKNLIWNIVVATMNLNMDFVAQIST